MLALIFGKNKKFYKNWIYVMITVNISSNLRHVAWSAVTNEFNALHIMALH